MQKLEKCSSPPIIISERRLIFHAASYTETNSATLTDFDKVVAGSGSSSSLWKNRNIAANYSHLGIGLHRRSSPIWEHKPLCSIWISSISCSIWAGKINNPTASKFATYLGWLQFEKKGSILFQNRVFSLVIGCSGIKYILWYLNLKINGISSFF